MKNFKSFVAEEKPNIKRKAKGEQDFVDAHEIEITDPTDQKNNSAKVTTKANSGKHKNDRADNKQEFGEDTGQADARKTTPSSKEAQQKVFDKHKERMKQLAKEEVELNDRADNKQEFGEAVKKTYQVSGKVLAAKMRQIPSLKSFADKFENKPIVTPQMVDKILPDYISGGEITKLFKESVEDLDENPIVGAIARAAISSAVKKAASSGSSNKEESVKPDVEKAFPASGVRKHDAPKGSSTMPKDKEKAKGRPAGSLKEEETQTYMVKFEKDGKVSLKNYEAKSDLDARSKAKVDAKRMGMTVASVRLKEEVEQIDEAQLLTVIRQKDGTHHVNVKTEFGEIKHIGTIHAPDKEGVRVAKYKDGTKVALSKNMDDLAKRLSGYHGKHMREEVELDEEQLREFDLYEGYEKKVLDYLDRKGVDARFVSGKLQVNKRDVAKAKMALKNAQGFDTSDLEVVAEAAYTNPGLERLAAAKKRNQPSHTNPGLEALAKKKKSLRQMKEEMGIGSINEADFSKQQTKMAHTIGKEFEKKGVGDESQGGPYAIASAMVRDKPEAAQKAYKTIQSKMKEETDAELLFNLYNDLNEENQEMFMSQLEEDADSLLQFAKNFLAD